MLRALSPLRTEYTTENHDLARDFYTPCLEASVQYDRITGYFSSLVFVLAWKGLRHFFMENDGKMRVICSPYLSGPDRDGVAFGYAALNDADLAGALRRELDRLLSQATLEEPTRALGALISQGWLSIRFAQVSLSAPAGVRRLFHDKVGVFQDSSNEAVGFRGSVNETFLGLSQELGHIESIDVFPSWVGGRDHERVENALTRFERIWNGGLAPFGVSLSPLPPSVEAELRELGKEVDLSVALRTLERLRGKRTLPDVQLRPHQARALEAWRKFGRRGIFAHATGSGKTITGAFAVREVLGDGKSALILAPSEEIQQQWAETIEWITGSRALRCGGGHQEWKDGLLRAAVRGGRPTPIVATVQTARTTDFMSKVRPHVENLLVIGDEVHVMGAPFTARFLDEVPAAYRLGLSATPERAGDQTGTQRILDYFGEVVDHYGLTDAIDDKYLTPYRYAVVPVRLSEREQAEWDARSTRIAQMAARLAEGGSDDLREKLRRALQERAKIKKGAAAKVPAAIRRLSQDYVEEKGHRWLVYCDSVEQVEGVVSGLRADGIPAHPYHSSMAGDRSATLMWFTERGGILVSIKCLDEGVDIPNADHGLILASSTNPREFIQRRGRLLRRAEGKTMADLVDLIVLPFDSSSAARSEAIMGPEFARALLFARSSLTPNTITQLENLWVEYGLDFEGLPEMAREGSESDDASGVTHD